MSDCENWIDAIQGAMAYKTWTEQRKLWKLAEVRNFIEEHWATLCIGRGEMKLLYPSNREFIDVGRIGLKAMTEGGHYGDERIMQRADGGQFWCAVRGRSTTKADPFSRCVWSFVDMSEQRLRR